MSAIEQKPRHVSETALMVAAARAFETLRSDALIRDPFAAQLAGDRGMTLLRAAPGQEWMMFGTGMRCRFVDELLLEAVSSRGIRTVVVLGAGLDTRPWRLDLPPALRWIEVDFPDMLHYKAAQLSGQPPQCRVERLQADLNESASREAVFQATAEAPSLMITEGLLMYLQPATVEALAGAGSFPRSGMRYWLLDVVSRDLMRRSPHDQSAIENLRPKDHLQGAQILDLARRHGWMERARRIYTRDAWEVAPARICEMSAQSLMPDERGLSSGGDPSGVYLLGR
jgi:methyltransferase (TIGR00027 family)